MIRKALGHLIRCKEASRLISQAQDTELPLGQRILLRLHLAACVWCTRFEQQVGFLRKAMHRYRE